MSDGLRETVALVTGASSGLGEATARAVAAQVEVTADRPLRATSQVSGVPAGDERAVLA